MELLNKAKNMISNIGEETIAEASFEKDNEPKEKPQKEKKPRAKKTVQRPKREKKPRMQKTPKKEEYVEVDVAVEDTKFDTFRNARGRNGEDFIDYDDFEKSEQPDLDTELEEDYVDVEDEIDSDTDFLDGKSKGVKFSDFEGFDSFSEGRHASHSQYDYEDDEEDENDYEDDLDSLASSSTSGLGAVTYKDVLDRLGIDEKILVPDDLMLDEDAANVKFDYQAPHGYNVTQVKEFHKTTMYSLAALMKMLKKRNVDILKLAEELASADDNSEIVERSISTARKIQRDKNLEIATHKKEVARLKELVDSQSKELKINKSSRMRDSAQMQELQDNLEGMNKHLKDLQRMLQERDAEIARQQEFLSEKDTFLEKKEEENKNLLKFNADLKHSVQIITEQREARERELKEQEEREKALQESQERKLREKIVVYESEDDESIINDMLNVKNLVTEREIEQEIQSAASLTDKDIISEEDLDVFAKDDSDNDDSKNANTVDSESTVANESEQPKEPEHVDSNDETVEHTDSNVDSVDSENSVDDANNANTDSNDEEDAQSEVFARFERAQKLLSAESESHTDANNEKEEELESEDSNGGNANNGDTEVGDIGDNEGKDSESQETAADVEIQEDVETEKSDDELVEDSEDEVADVDNADKDSTESNVDNDSNDDNSDDVEDSKPVKVSRPKRTIVGEDDLEDSMTLLASGTAEIDFEKDLSAESSQELQERQLLNDIGMVEEDDSEELDMDALSSFLKKN